jgi:hypothetical protein
VPVAAYNAATVGCLDLWWDHHVCFEPQLLSGVHVQRKYAFLPDLGGLVKMVGNLQMPRTAEKSA